jgi:hypothetical protein
LSISTTSAKRPDRSPVSTTSDLSLKVRDFVGLSSQFFVDNAPLLAESDGDLTYTNVTRERLGTRIQICALEVNNYCSEYTSWGTCVLDSRYVHFPLLRSTDI